MRQSAALLLLLLLSGLPGALTAETIRLATFNTDLSRKGPGLLLRDLQRDNAQIDAVIDTIRRADADILALQSIDWDYDTAALAALQLRLAAAGQHYPYRFAPKPNAGIASDHDLDGDGRLGEPEDAWGWGRFTGQSGIALLSKYPITTEHAIDLTGLLWHEVPDHRMPVTKDGLPYPDAETAKMLRLSSTSHWAVPVMLPDDMPLWVMSFHAAPPVFDGPEDRNGRRNADELLIWLHLLDGTLGARPTPPFVLLGDANNDPARGEGHKDALSRLLTDPRLRDTLPADENGLQHTVTWESTGPMRVDYALPSAELQVAASGIIRGKGSRHGLVWIDIRR